MNYQKYLAFLSIVSCLSTARALPPAENRTYLHAKNPVTWAYDMNGAWGMLAWRTAEGKITFTFDGHKLKTNFDYTLVYYPDPIPGNGLICIGTGKTDRKGKIRIKGKVSGPLPKRYDKNFGKGAKIWLVGAKDLNCQAQKFVDGNPKTYLYGSRWVNIK